jgi:peptidoglycan/LPS O-acetylase OafA/YrhL
MKNAEQAAAHPAAQPESRPASQAARMPGLDFAKGALVLIMVLYHWTNYFFQVDDSLFRYVRFLTPSFIFITGFLIGQVYLPRASSVHIPSRLASRGLKLLAIAACLNLALHAVQGSVQTRTSGESLGSLALAFFAGTAPVAFSILVPIAYLLLSSAGLFIARRSYRGAFHVASTVLIVTAIVLEWNQRGNGYVEVVSIGMLGVSVGHVPIRKLDGLIRQPLTMFAAYAAYVAAVAMWNVWYWVQIAGVCVNVALLYWLGEAGKDSSVSRLIARVGGYSLFGYIAQIAILQVLRAGLRPLGPGLGVGLTALVLGMICTVLSVEILDWTRHRVTSVNRLYSAVFA